MAVRYLKVSNTPFDLKSFPSLSSTETSWQKEGITVAQTRTLMTWMGTVWTLAMHCVLSVGVTIFLLAYVEGRHFSPIERSPVVHVVGGTRLAPFCPMQSDIVTILSSIIAILRCALSAWIASLSWYIALFLMERRGLTRRDLKVLLNYGLLAPGAYWGDWSTLVIGALLLVGLVANFSSPILTGSVCWIPSSQLVRGLSVDPVQISAVENGTLTQLKANYRDNYSVRESYAISSVGEVGIGWGRDTDKSIIKRITNSVGTLSINSTIESVTLPYFQIHSIHWIKDRDEIPAIRDGATPTSIFRTQFEMTPSNVSDFPAGYAMLIPNITTHWSGDPLDSTIIHDTRLLIMNYAYDDLEASSGVHTLTQDLPSDAYTLSSRPFHYAFAWVTFSAGIGRCKEYSCVVSSPSTIRNNTPVELEPHQLTFQALAMAPVVGFHLVMQNNSLPYLWSNINDYVEAVLVRSYSGSWCGLNKGMGTSTADTSYVPSLPNLMADVDHSRVFVWLGLQLLVTLFSILFLIVQSRLSKCPLMGDTSLTAFDLDTTGVVFENTDSSIHGFRKIEQRGGRLKLKVE
ncbi:transmembrane protein, putative [Rhizoctonia solani AG-3 Rhs1AP]|uniref:Transmembrane protein, putative n=1 Tax=Rhizoctonia solani AG-3 Rhs1AP TaxID=1086054 RepID=X8JB79_9AGAM|nr:transmembrane protein, putative [Rhizoctonia solani AG-3 Rhs1AP]